MDVVKNNSPAPPPNDASIALTDINSLIETQVNAATSALRSEFETKFTNINNKVDTVEKSIKAVTESTTKLENSISKLEETQASHNFLRKIINFQQVGRMTSPARRCEISSRYSTIGELGPSLKSVQINSLHTHVPNKSPTC